MLENQFCKYARASHSNRYNKGVVYIKFLDKNKLTMRRTHLKTIKYHSLEHTLFPISLFPTLLIHLMQLQVPLVGVTSCREIRTTCTRHDVLRGLCPASCAEGNSVLGLRRFPTPSDSCHIDPSGPDLARDAQIFGKNEIQLYYMRVYT